MTCMVVAYFFTKGKVDSRAYENGKEAPSVVKARMRQENGGVPGGAFRNLIASRWANACLAAQQKGEQKAARQRAWYAERAPHEDAEWREKQLARLNKSDADRAQWAANRGLIDLDAYRKRVADEEEARKENARRNAAATDPAAKAKAPDPAGTGTAKPTGEPDPAKPAEAATAGGKDETKPAAPADTPVAGTGSSEPAGTSTDPGTASEAKPADDKAEPEKPSEGCPWVPLDKLDKNEPCGATPRRNSRFCDEHSIEGEISPCQFGTLPYQVQCQRTREPDSAYCKVHRNAESPPAGQPAGASKNDKDETSKPPQPTKPSAAPAAESQKTGTTEGVSTLYQKGVEDLIRAADQVAEYRTDLAAFADTLAGKKWGAQVTGPVQDMDSTLVALEGDYRDLAARMKHEGDQGAAAYDQAPYVPGPEAVLA